jgi:hypothetical protein
MSCTLDLGRISGVKIADFSGKMWIEPGWGLNQTFYQHVVLALQIWVLNGQR